jgi:TonB family protein
LQHWHARARRHREALVTFVLCRPARGSIISSFSGCSPALRFALLQVHQPRCRGEVELNHIPIRSLGGSRWVQSRLWAGLLVAIIPFTWCKPASAQDIRKVKFSVQPAYPELAKRNKIQGVTRLQVIITPDGVIKDIKVLGGNPVLVQASVEAVQKWKYEPAPAESTAVLRFEFKPD